VRKVRHEEDCLCSQRIELLSGSLSNTLVFHLSVGDHVRHLDAAQQDAGTPEILEPKHGAGTPFDRPMVLLDEVVEIFGLADPDRRFTIGIDRFECSEIGTAFVDRYGLGDAVLSERFLKVTPGCDLVPMGAQQEVDGFAVLRRAVCGGETLCPAQAAA
jgi:hypothetical protein